MTPDLSYDQEGEGEKNKGEKKVNGMDKKKKKKVQD